MNSFVQLPSDTSLNTQQICIINKPYREWAVKRTFSYLKEHPKEAMKAPFLGEDFF